MNKLKQNEQISRRIKELADQNNISINELAKRSNLRQSTISAILNEGNVPTITTLGSICKGLETNIHNFFDFPPYNSVKKKEATEVTSN